VTDAWTTLTPKPVPVADVGAAVIGGQIYVPGGRTAVGGVTGVLESYDPRRDQWQEHASLPVAISAYALTAFEGRLYLFGGWDGQKYLASVYEYDPGRDKWTERTRMPTARGQTGATVAGGIIYVIGGYDGTRSLAVNEGYAPEREGSRDGPWQSYRPLPAARFGMGVTSIADIVLIIGGEGKAPAQSSLEYFPQRDQWQAIETSIDQPLSRLGLAAVGTNLHALGGEHQTGPTAAHWAYQAIFTTMFPFVSAP
jgi:N-acetylneuraminic acid mutarotase